MIKSAYIHIPFCEHICHYCDFNKVLLKNQPVDQYLDDLEQEMRLMMNLYPINELQTIFVGGGTPTSLTEQQLSALCESININLPKSERIEYTFEANPGDLSMEKLQILKEAGVNRISLGVQSFNDELLKKIGREHRAIDVIRSIAAIKKAGFENINIDLIFSLPSQTIEDFSATLQAAFALNIPHFSGYSLIIEPKTVFYHLMNKGKLPVPGEDAEADMYELLMEEMEKHGYRQYEISNFSRPGFESKHNLTYWLNQEYYGFGAGAHSYVNGCRRSNLGVLKRYMDQVEKRSLPVLEEHKLTVTEQMEEEMFLGLRITEGVSIPNFIEKFGKSPIELFAKQINNLIQNQLLEIKHEKISLTTKGRLLGNEVFQLFLLT